jgi:Negative regulator of septation ring formation
LEKFNPQFEEYDQLTASGNYLKAREIVVSLKEEGQTLFKLINEIPTLLTEIQHKIPSDIHEIRNGHQEMEEQSYFLVHLEILEKLNQIEENLVEFKQKIADLDIAPVQLRVVEIKDEIESFYDALEKEVIGRKYVDDHFTEIGDLLESAIEATEKTVRRSRGCSKKLSNIAKRSERTSKL